MGTHSTRENKMPRAPTKYSGVQIKAYDNENHAQTYYGFIEEIRQLD